MRSLRFLLWTTFQLHVLGYFFDTINSTDQKPRLDAAERNIDCAQEHQAILAMPSPLLPGFYSMCTSLLQPTTSTIYQTQTISQTFATSVTYDYLVTWPYGESVSTTLVTSSVIITATPSSSITQTAEVFTSYVPTAQAASTTSHSGPKGKGVKRAPVIPTALAPPKQRWGNFASALAEASDATKACSCFLGPSQSVTSTVYTTVVSSSIELDTSISITAVPATTSTKIDVATMVSTTTAAPAVQTLQAIRTYWLVAETIGAAYSYAGVGGTERTLSTCRYLSSRSRLHPTTPLRRCHCQKLTDI